MKAINKKLKLTTLSLLITLTITGCPTAGVTPDTSSVSPSGENNKSEQDPASALSSPGITSDPNVYASTSPSSYPAPMPTATAASPNNSGVAVDTMTDSQNKVAIRPTVEEDITKDNIFNNYGVNPFTSTKEDNLSTFGLDVDTASYTWMRKSLLNNLLVTKDSVRPEEYINYFDYDYPQPEASDKFSISTELVKLKNINVLKVGLQSLKINNQQRKNAHLTLLVDVSGSMDQENRLGLVKESTKLLVNNLTSNDYISIVVYGTEARTVLEHSNDKEKIISAIESLKTEGSTNTEAGLNLAYQVAKEHYRLAYINKVILCSDGFANVGSTTPDALLTKIRQDALSGISLSTVGFGMGNYNDIVMEQLANKGDGSYAYVDDLKEANRIFVQNLTGTLQTVAKDSKIQVYFDPNVVSEYRLIGYENRDIADNDFRNDKVDAGDIGSDQKVTALYEIILKENPDNTKSLAKVSLRYKDIEESQTVKEMAKEVKLSDLKDFDNGNSSTKTAISVAVYAEILKSAYWSRIFSFDDVIGYAQQASQNNDNDKLKEFISLVNKAKTLKK